MNHFEASVGGAFPNGQYLIKFEPFGGKSVQKANIPFCPNLWLKSKTKWVCNFDYKIGILSHSFELVSDMENHIPFDSSKALIGKSFAHFWWLKNEYPTATPIT